MSIILNDPTYIITIDTVTIHSIQIDCDIKVNMTTLLEPDNFTVKLYNIDTARRELIREGSIVNIRIGYNTSIPHSLITGVIDNMYSEDTDEDQVIVIEGFDLNIYKLKSTPINLSFNASKDVMTIIKSICNVAAVPVSILSKRTYVMLENYTVSTMNAYDATKELIDRVEYSATSKNGQMYFQKKLVSIITEGVVITDKVTMEFTRIQGSTSSGDNAVSGYRFFGVGLPSISPLAAMSVAKSADGIFGNFMVSTVVHNYSTKEGYFCHGTIVPINIDRGQALVSSTPTATTVVHHISNMIENSFVNRRTIDTGEVEQAFTSNRFITNSYGMRAEEIQGTVSPSVEADVGKDNVFLVRKPLMSPFAGDGFGLVVPVYKGMRSVIGFNRFNSQDANVLGFLWKKGWTVPDHDEGDYMLHHKNHSKYIMKEDGSVIHQVKSMLIQVGTNYLTISKPTAAGVGEFKIQFDTNKEIIFDGTDIIINTTGTVKIGENASNVEVGKNANVILAGGTKLVALNGDDVNIDPAWLAKLAAHLHPSAAPGPPAPPTPPLTVTKIGTILTSATKTKAK